MHFRIFYMFLSFNCLFSERGGCDRISRMFLIAFEATTHIFFSVMFPSLSINLSPLINVRDVLLQWVMHECIHLSLIQFSSVLRLVQGDANLS